MTPEQQPDRRQPLVSVDMVALRWDGERLEFALHERQHEPFVGRSALPGVLLLPGEFLADAVHRAAATKLGLTDLAIAHASQVGAFDGTNRDPRGATISIAYLAVVDIERSDLELGRWEVSAEALPFDHDTIVSAAIASLGLRLWKDWPLTRALLGAVFTTKSALALSHRLDALPNRASNIARWLEASGQVERVGQSGRAALWKWIESKPSRVAPVPVRAIGERRAVPAAQPISRF